MTEPTVPSIRNASFNASGTIDCEIEHPQFGWIPFTADPADPEPLGALIHAAALAAGPSPYVAPAPTPIDPKLVGVEFNGVMCSATAADQAGSTAVLLAIQLKGSEFRPTRFYFENGNTVVITLQNYQAFTSVWLPFRQSFFTVE